MAISIPNGKVMRSVEEGSFSPNSIFVVTVASLKHFLRTLLYDDIEQRHIGWYTTLEKARENVLNNTLDINEGGSYEYAVIEEIREGMYGDSMQVFYFKFNNESGKYEEVDKPDAPNCSLGYNFFTSCNYSIG